MTLMLTVALAVAPPTAGNRHTRSRGGGAAEVRRNRGHEKEQRAQHDARHNLMRAAWLAACLPLFQNGPIAAAACCPLPAWICFARGRALPRAALAALPFHECGRGGTGRRATLRSLWAKARGSSSLLDRTSRQIEAIRGIADLRAPQGHENQAVRGDCFHVHRLIEARIQIISQSRARRLLVNAGFRHWNRWRPGAIWAASGS